MASTYEKLTTIKSMKKNFRQQLPGKYFSKNPGWHRRHLHFNGVLLWQTTVFIFHCEFWIEKFAPLQFIHVSLTFYLTSNFDDSDLFAWKILLLQGVFTKMSVVWNHRNQSKSFWTLFSIRFKTMYNLVWSEICRKHGKSLLIYGATL